MRKRIWNAVWFSVLFALPGCIIGPSFSPPELSTVPQEFSVQPVLVDSSVEERKESSPEIDLATWWNYFEDPQLTELVDEAIKNNLQLKVALARVREARSEVNYTLGGFLPQVGASASAKREQVSPSSLMVQSNTNSQVAQNPKNTYRANFDALWEFNIFGSGRALESAEASLAAEEEAARYVLISLISEVAQNYTSLRGFQQQKKIVEQNVEIQKEALELQRLKLQAGTANDLTVSQVEGQLAATQSAIPPLTTQITLASHRIAILLGKSPTELNGELSQPGELPTGSILQSPIPIGLPTELLRRRPDIRRAEAELHAATANIGVAISDLFPSFTLSGVVGAQSFRIHNISRSTSEFWNFLGGVALPIFNEEKYAQIGIQNARQDQAMAAYQLTVLQGLSEVEDGIVALNEELTRRSLLEKTVSANKNSLVLAQKLSQAGIIDFLNVITAQQALFESESLLSQSNITVSLNIIALYKSLGGGWEVQFKNESL